MLKNYLKIALRNLWQRKFYSALNIGGLAIGLSVAMVIVFYVKHEFSYDTYNEKSGRIARISMRFETPEQPLKIASSPELLAYTLNKDYPEIERTVRFAPTAATFKMGQKLLNEQDIYEADQAVFDVFTYHFLEGIKDNALNRPNTVVLTKELANRYFGKNNALGKTLIINKKLVEITGVIADLPSNSDMKISALLSAEFENTKTWLDDFPVYTFALFKNKPDLKSFGKKLLALSKRHLQPELKASGADGYSVVFEPEMLQDVHYSQSRMGDRPKGNRLYGYLFSFLAVFILIIAVLNYVNLLTASATERSKEVGIRKANGARRGQLIRQFLFESFIVSSISISIAALILLLTAPSVNTLLEINIPVNWGEILLLSVISLLIITIFGGLYPSFVLSSFKPAQALKGKLTPNGQGVWLRKSITLFQFSMAVAMIFGVLVIRQQMQFLQQHNPGFDKEQLISLSVPDDSVARSKVNDFASLLRQKSKIQQVTAGSASVEPDALLSKGTTIFQGNGKKRETMSSYLFIDEHFIPTLNIKFAQGRNLSASNVSDKTKAFIVNEAFVKMAGWENPIGQAMSGYFHKGQVVGVVKNFNYMTLHNEVEPLVMIYNTLPPSGLIVKAKPENVAVIERNWKHYYPDFPFEYKFLDASFAAQYRKEHIMMVLFNAFAFLTVLVSCLGLLSLVTFSTRIRTKEIGIRKVLGASVSGIVAMLSGEYLWLIIIAFVIASPVAYYLMDKWLQNFAYRVEISWLTFAAAGIIATVIAFGTISFQSIKTALMNPVKSLRSD